MRITASWSGSLAHRIQGCGRSSSTTRGLPSNVVIPTRSSVPSCSKPSRTSLRWALTRPSLTASARAGECGCVGRGEETAARSNKETDGQEDGWDPCGTPLTKSAPYKRTRK